MTARHWIAVALGVAVVGMNACSSGPGDLGRMEVKRDRGKVQILRGNEVIDVGEVASLEPQDVVVTGATGLAHLNLETSDQKVSLAPGSRLRIRSTTSVEGQQGSILATASGAPMKVLFDGVTSSFNNARFRLDRGFGSARAAAYEGQIELESPGQQRVQLNRLWQADVAAGDLPERASPYRIDTGDEWDQDYLGSVVTLTQDLTLLAKGFDRQLSGSRPTLDYFSSISEGQKIGFLSDYLGRRPADLLVAFTIASNDGDLNFASSFQEAFDYFDLGAQWGVAAGIMRVPAHPLLAQLEDLIVGTGVVASNGTGGAGGTTFAFGSGGTSGGPGSGTDTGTTGGGDQSVRGGVGGTTDNQVQDCADFADCTVQDVQKELPPGPGPAPGPGPNPGITPPGNGGSNTGGGGLTDGLLDGTDLP
jgi:hypothetical protein